MCKVSGGDFYDWLKVGRVKWEKNVIVLVEKFGKMWILNGDRQIKDRCWCERTRMENFSVLDARKQELLEARLLGSRVCDGNDDNVNFNWEF